MIRDLALANSKKAFTLRAERHFRDCISEGLWLP